MSPISARDVCQNGSVKSFGAAGSMFEIDSEFLRLSDKPRPVNVERKRSFDERSFSENSFRIIDHLENLSPAGRRSGFNTPRSCGFESHPMVVDAWESLRRTLVYFRSQPVGTIAALDHSVEELNYDQSAIGRVAPVDSGFWWIVLLRAYTKSTGDSSLAEMPECQRGMRLILNLCLSEGFDTFPTLLCADGCCMIDRRMVGLQHNLLLLFIPE
ncbi:hypothetical protein D5086_011610 [Populus alba]|uniref:Uncharacterized protein n=1 Tax=Populus alba TaxID=43335 RepID=A0ACC4CDH5_POPAL